MRKGPPCSGVEWMMVVDPKLRRGSAKSQNAKHDPPWIAPPKRRLEHTNNLALGADVVPAGRNKPRNMHLPLIAIEVSVQILDPESLRECRIRACFELLCAWPGQQLHRAPARVPAVRGLGWREGVLCAPESALLPTCLIS